MRALVVLCLVSACGDTGLMLDVHPGTGDVTSVEVFLPKDQVGDQMGLPMAGAKTDGTVFETADRVTATASGDVSILLQPGEIDEVSELLVLGYDANHQAIRYAEVSSPDGPLQLPHTHANTIKVDLDPIAEVAAKDVTKANPANGPLLVRWSHTMVDDPNGDCVALLTDDGIGGFEGDVYSPGGDDVDCDGANPECDDTWYLEVGVSSTPQDNPLCVRDDQSPDTMDACRLGNTVACTDNVGDCKVPTDGVVCVPASVCDKCNDQIDSSCFVNAVTDDSTPYIECDLSVGPNPTTQEIELCNPNNQTDVMPVDLASHFGGTFGITGSEFDQPPNTSGGTNILDLGGSQTAKITVTPPQIGARGLVFTAENGATPAIDNGLPDTRALLVFTVHGGVTRTLVLPFVAHYVRDCTAQPACRLVIGVDNGQPFDDPIWHCSGT